MSTEKNVRDSSTEQKAPPPKKLKWIWKILLSIVLLLLILIAGLSWIVGTETGTQWSLNTAQQHLPELTIDTPSGSIWQGIGAVSLRWQQEDMTIQIDALKTQWRFGCLLEGVFCIDEISAAAINVQLPRNNTKAEATESSEPFSLPDITLPVGLDLKRLTINRISVDLGDGSDAQIIDEIELSVSAQQNQIELRNLSLAYQQYSALLNGGIELSGEYPVNFKLTALAKPLFENHNQNLNLSLAGSLQNLIIDGHTTGLADVGFSATVKPLDKQLPYSANVTWEKIVWPPKPDPTQITSSKGKVTAKGNLETYAVTLENSIEGEGIPSSNIRLNGKGDLEQFQLAELLMETLSGKISIDGNVNWRDGIQWATNVKFENIDPAVQWPDIPGELDGAIVANGIVEGEKISVALEKLAVDGRVLEYPLSLRVSADHANDQTITLKNLTLQIDENDAGAPKTRLTVSGKGDYSHFVASDVKVESLGGEINGSAKVNWSDPISPGRIQWLTTLALSDIDPGQQWSEYPGQLSGNIVADGSSEGEAWTLNLKNADIIGQLREYPLAINAILNRSADGQFTIDKVALNSGDNQIQMAGSLTDSWSLDGDLLINQPEALLPDLKGTAQGSFAIRGARETPDIELNANIKSLSIQDLEIETVTIEANIAALGQSGSQLAVKATGLKASELELTEVDVDLSGKRSDHKLVFSTNGEIDTSIELKGALDDALNWLGALTSADIDTYQQAWSLQKSTAIEWLNETQSINLAAHCWGQDTARVCLDEDATIADSGNAKFSIRDFSIASLQAYFPKHAAFQGIVVGDGDLKWQAGKQPQVNVKLKVRDGGIKVSGQDTDETLDLRYQALSADIVADENKVTAELLLNSNDIGNASAAIIINPEADNRTISGDVSLEKLELVTFKAFFPQLQTLTGTFSANGKISGSLTAPKYIGGADISGLNVMSDDLPISIKDGFMRAKIDGARTDIDAGWQSGNAPVTLTGNADWQDLDSPVINLALKGKNIDVRQAPSVIAKVSPNIKLRMNGKDIKISGRVDIPYARVTIQELPPSATQISKDVIVIVEEDAPTKDKKRLNISTNVVIFLGKDVRLEGFGLRAGLTGNIGIEQKPDGVALLDGEVLIPDGIYKAYGQNLTIQHGRLLFVGPIDQTAIDIDAVRIVDSVTAGLKVRGSIKKPEVTLFSSPQQTQENTLSYIVLGKPIGAKSGGSEAGILAQAALSLGIAGGRGIATSIAEQFGIQDFQIDTTGDGDESQVQLSGRLSPNLLLSYGVGVLTPVNTLTLRYNLTENFYVETAQSVESALDFFYTFDF